MSTELINFLTNTGNVKGLHDLLKTIIESLDKIHQENDLDFNMDGYRLELFREAIDYVPGLSDLQELLSPIKEMISIKISEIVNKYNDSNKDADNAESAIGEIASILNEALEEFHYVYVRLLSDTRMLEISQKIDENGILHFHVHNEKWTDVDRHVFDNKTEAINYCIDNLLNLNKGE